MTRRTVPSASRIAAILVVSGAVASIGFAQSEQSFAAPGFDGVYTGVSRLIVNTSQACAPGQTISVEVRNGRFRLPWQTTAAFDVRLSPDGRFNATAGVPTAIAEKRMMIVPTAQGQVSGTSLVADYGTRFCHYAFEAVRS